MAKRTLAWLLCLAMLLSFAPVVAMEANAVGSGMPGATEFCDHTSHSGWQAWTSKTTLPTESGKYYLTEDVTLSSGGWYPSGLDIHLCLNGKNITQTKAGQRVIGVLDGTKLYIYDCTATVDAAGNYIAGKLSGGTQTIGAGINVNRGGLLHLYGGIITGNHKAGTNGGGVYLQAATSANKTAGMFNMYGGQISGNSCANGAGVYVAGGVNESGYTNAVFNMYGGRIIGNSATGNGGAITAVAYGTVNITDGIITGNTTAAGAAVSVTDNAKITVCGDTVIAGNTNAANTADVVVADKLYVNELTGGSNITVQTTADQTDANQVLAVNGKQTASWQAGWVTYMKQDGSTQDMGYITSGSGKTFAFGHYHGDQKYTAYDGGADHIFLKDTAGYYYLTADITRSATSSAHVSMQKNVEQHLCLNGHKVTHNNPAIRLYYLDAGDKLYIEDCTSYYNEKDQFVAGGIYFGGASNSTVTDGSFMQVNKGGFASLENIKVSGFTSTKSPVLRVLGEAANRGTLNLKGVEITDNSNTGTAAVIYANTGATVNMTDCVFKNNTAKSASVINTGGDAQVTLTDCIITGNTTSSYGTLNVANGKTVFKLEGATQVYGNQGGNLHLQKGDAYVYNLDGLTQGAKVGITLHKDRIAENQMHFTNVVAEGKNPMPYCFSDDDTYKVAMDAKGRLALVENTGEEPVDPPTPPSGTHTHKLCADSACTEHGADVTFTAWDDATKLPDTTGNYYLTTDVTITERAGLRGANVTLCLNGHTIKAADSYTTKSRAFYLYDTSKLTLTDCAKTPGKITNFKSGALMCDGGCTDAAINAYNIEISGNTNTGSGGAIIIQGTSALNLYNVKVKDNDATGLAGGIYIAGKSTATITDSQITGNTATTNGGGINLQSGAKLTLAGTTQVTGNTGGSYGGGIYRHSGALELKITDDVKVTGNTVNGAASNLYLAGTSKFTVENLGKNANVGVSTAAYDRAVSTTVTTDYSDRVISDNADYTISHKDNALYLGEAVKHSHCVCAGTGCSHEALNFQPWTSTTKLPDSSGNYFLTGDVTITDRAGLKGANVTLCLNGFTIKAADSYTTKSRAFYLYDTSKLTLTDCAATPGKITNFKNSAIMCDGTCTDAQIDIYNIEISGNTNTNVGGAIVLQGVSELNFHSGKIADNTCDGNAGAINTIGTATVNLIGGEISGNTSAKNGGAIVGDSSKTVINLSGTKITGNRAASGGGVLLQNRAHLNMTGGEITGNTATSNGGGVYISTNSSMAMSGGKVTGNISDNNTAGISVQTGAKLTLSGDAQITGNTAEGNYGGLYIHNQNGGVSISGNVQISGNTSKGQASNLYLAGTSKFTAGKLGENGNVGISTGQYFRAISNEVAEDVSAGYFSDNKSLAVSYQDNALFLGAPDGHSHCFCAADNNHCNHAQVKFAPWEKTTSLPTSGNWYLTSDVVIKDRAGLTDVTLNLCLNGHTIRVHEDYKKGRAFYLYGDSKLTITDCNEKPGIITGAKETAVMFDGTCVGAEYNMYNITMTGNNTTTGGGAVLVQGEATFNMYSGTMIGNTATAIVLTDADGNPKLDANGNQQVKNNMGGGAVASSAKNAVINIYGGTLTQNHAIRCTLLKADGTTTTSGGNGGAIYAKGHMNIYDADIYDNVAEGNGGGILVGGNETTITIHGGRITGNTGRAGGGFISQNRTNVIINGGEISGNKGTEAGGVYVSTNSKLTMNGGTIANNTSSGKGGGMFVLASTVTLNAGTIKNNKAAGDGGGICSNKYTTTVDGKSVDIGPVITVNKDFSITGNYAEKNAGGVMINGRNGSLTLDGGSISGNTAKAAAGGVLVQNYCTFYLKSGKVNNNNANTGGGIYVSTNTNLKMTGGSVSGNSTIKSSGAGIQLLRSTATLSGGSITGNKSGGAGGGVYLSGATAYLYGTYIANNTAKTNGGGVGTGQATAKVDGVTQKFQCKLVLSGSTIEKNEAANGGGVIVQSYTVFDITGGVIRNNKATSAAGGVYVSTNATLNMTGGSVIGNHAVKNGGGLYHMNSKGNYTGGIIEGNTTDANAAAFLGSGANTVINVKGYDFTGLQAVNGSVATIQSKAVFNVEDCKFYDNQATGGAGAVYISTNSFGSFINCKFYNNKAEKQGGAILGAQNSNVTITDCIFTENTAGTEGGAILCRGSFYMTNCQVADNTAGGNGGGIATGKCGIRGSKFQDGLMLTNVTVTDNTSGALGGGLYLSTGCKTTLTDVEITGNQSAAEGGAYWAVDDTTFHNVTVANNASGGEGYAAWYDYSIFDGHSYFVGVHKISGDIIFKDNQGGDMYFDQDVAMSIDYEGLGENTVFGVTLDAGVLTNRLYGEYDYEGGNRVYTVTYGSRSFTEPEIDEAMAAADADADEQKSGTNNVLLYVGIGVIGLAAVAAGLLVALKKKKAGKPAETTKE